jgi:hypothetical protein
LVSRVLEADISTLTRHELESYGCRAGRLGEPDAPEAEGRRRNKAPQAPHTPPTGSPAGGAPVGGQEGFECSVGRWITPGVSA